jgi:hypothetical protein
MTEANPQPSAPAAPAQQGQQVQVMVRDEKALNTYANFVNITSGPNAEDLTLHFATQFQSPERPNTVLMDVNSRVSVSFYWAKRLALMLSQAVQRYEQQFGPVELDPHKRLKQG